MTTETAAQPAAICTGSGRPAMTRLGAFCPQCTRWVAVIDGRVGIHALKETSEPAPG